LAGLIYKELWHDPKTCEWSARWSSDIGWLWVKLISFVEDHDSKGYLTEKQALTVADLNNVPRTAIAQLVEARGLDRQDDGRYRIHNYGQRGKLSRIRAQAGQKGGSKTASKFAQANALANSGVGVVVRKIFEIWKGTLGGRHVTLTSGRIRVIRARLNEGYPEAELIEAAQGWQHDPWADRVNQNDLTILFRNGEQVEKFRDFFRHPPAKNGAGKPAPSAGARALFEAAERERRRAG
jgi:hypothetical protein